VPRTYVRVLFHGYFNLNQITVGIEVLTKEIISLYGTNIKTQFSHSVYTGWSCALISAAIMGYCTEFDSSNISFNRFYF
jgi:hypothetical protein